MKKIPCLNYCEELSILEQSKEEFWKSYHRALKMAGFSFCERIYFGSNFCSQLFLSLSSKQIKNLIDLSTEKGIKLTLVVPIFTERELVRGKEKVHRMLPYLGALIDEITVNDYGMLVYLYNEYVKEGGRIHLNIGRLFMKDYRDPRYPIYFNQVYQPKAITPYFLNLVSQFQVSGIEIDPTHQTIDLSECLDSLQVGLHTPFCYMTVGQICEYASISQPLEKKFRPNQSCKRECITHQIRYLMDENRTWLRIGRAVCFENKDCMVKGIDTIRIIYFPVELGGE